MSEAETTIGVSCGNTTVGASPFEGAGHDRVGRDPRTVSAAKWAEYGVTRRTGMQLVRLKCFDCVYTAGEIRKCVQFSCPLWPYRMGSAPKGPRALRNRDDETDFGASDVSTPCQALGATSLRNPHDDAGSEGGT